MNFSHGEYEYHQSVIDNTRKMVAGASTSRYWRFHPLTYLSFLYQRILLAAQLLLLWTLLVPAKHSKRLDMY